LVTRRKLKEFNAIHPTDFEAYKESANDPVTLLQARSSYGFCRVKTKFYAIFGCRLTMQRQDP